tara:strand:+ start:181 stop:324 length:144 start_codon:yes stop_codon:yes gene_type:complete
MTIGAIYFPKNKPNLNQSEFKGISNIELIIPKNKKIKPTIKDQILIL